MVNQKLISTVDKHLEEIAQAWLEDAKTSEYMKTYHNFADKELFKRGKAVYLNLVEWLKSGAQSESVEKYFEKVGAVRLEEGFPLSEVQYALYLSKKVFWEFVDWRDAITGSFESSTTTQIMSVFNNYFDLGNFFITKGYFKEFFEKLDNDKKYSKEELTKLLTESTPDWEKINEDEIIWRHV